MLWKISVIRSISLRNVARRVRHSRFLEAAFPQQTRVAVPARPPTRIGVVAGVRERIVDAESGAAADDVRLRQLDKGRDDARLTPLKTAPGAAQDHLLKCGDEFRAAIGIAAAVHSV